MFSSLADPEKAGQRGKFLSIKIYPRKQEKISNKPPNLTPIGTRKRRKIKPKVSRRKKTFRSEKK